MRTQLRAERHRRSETLL